MTETRTRIERYIEANPGVHFRELTRALDLATGQVQYHLRRLESVVAEPINGRTHYYPAKMDPWERRTLAFLRRETARDILLALLADAPRSPGAVTAELDVARSTLEHHLDGLVEHGIVAKRREGNRVTLALRRPDATAALLRVVDPSLPERLADRFERLVDSFLEAE